MVPSCLVDLARPETRLYFFFLSHSPLDGRDAPYVRETLHDFRDVGFLPFNHDPSVFGHTEGRAPTKSNSKSPALMTFFG